MNKSLQYIALTPYQALAEADAGTVLYFGDGYPEQYYIDGAGELLSIDPLDSYHLKLD
jgi:hypothetical protein